MTSNRQWINARLRNGLLNREFEVGIEEFVELAKKHPEHMDGNKIRCPCNHRHC